MTKTNWLQAAGHTECPQPPPRPPPPKLHPKILTVNIQIHIQTQKDTHTSLENVGSIAPFEGAVPPLITELVLAFQGAQADSLHQRLGHARVTAAHAPLLLLQLESVAQLVVGLGHPLLRLRAQRQDGQGFITCQSGNRNTNAETHKLSFALGDTRQSDNTKQWARK